MVMAFVLQSKCLKTLNILRGGNRSFHHIKQVVMKETVGFGRSVSAQIKYCRPPTIAHAHHISYSALWPIPFSWCYDWFITGFTPTSQHTAMGRVGFRLGSQISGREGKKLRLVISAFDNMYKVKITYFSANSISALIPENYTEWYYVGLQIFLQMRDSLHPYKRASGDLV